jgi:type IV pilus assembly protein PilC
LARAWEYEALTSTGSVTRGRMDAESEYEVEERLRSKGDFLIRLEALDAEAGRAAPEDAGEPPRAGPRTDGVVSRKELLAFTEFLWGSLTAGIPILSALEDVEVQLDSKRMRRIVAEIRGAISAEGKSLSEALAEHPQAFPSLYVGTVEAGESTGQLDVVLQHLVDYLEWQQEITIQVRQATLYPAILLLVMLGLVSMLVTFVFPRLLPVFAGFNVELPLPTRIVFRTGMLLRENWRWLVFGIASVTGVFLLMRRTGPGRLLIDTWKLRMPIFGPLVHQIEMSRVVTYIALFYRAGIDLLRGLGVLEQIIENRRVARAIAEARGRITGGESIARAFAATGLFPQVVIRSLVLGESTGRLDEALDRARAYYAREVPAAVRRLLTALQPLLILVLGLILGVVALSIFLPMMRIYQEIGP